MRNIQKSMVEVNQVVTQPAHGSSKFENQT